MGGGPVGLTYANDLAKDTDEAAWKHLEEHIHFLFPSLNKVALSYRWGGPFSVTIDLAPAMGYLGDVNVVYSLGCIGHGVSMSHLNGKAICDMLLERQSDLMDCPFINRRVIAWPPEPLRIIAAGALRGYLQLEDWYYERDLSEN
jgi:glycine/D-amino acid oxidase-like deaminating enzyme